tara:strand:- start:29 stop:328 length:300 start_codon:yes stop_codon:yes gene_type:complete
MNERSLFEDTKPRLVSHFTYINSNIGYSKQLLRIGDWVTVMGEPSCYQITKILSDGFFFATDIDRDIEINTTVYDIMLTLCNSKIKTPKAAQQALAAQE